MRRLFAVFTLISACLGSELVHPYECTLMRARIVRLRRAKD